MKKLLGLATVAALFAGVQTAQAVPTLKLSMTQSAGTALQCTALGGTYSGSSCDWSTTTGLINALGTYGDYLLNQELAVGFPVQAQPSLWLNSTNASAVNGSSITLALVASDYSTPINMFGLLSTASGTVDAGMTVELNSYFDVNNTGVAGAGIQLLDADWTGFASGAVPYNITHVTNDGDFLYSVSWVLTVYKTSGAITTAGINGTLAQAAPAPAAGALLGLGLLAVGFIRRRAK